MKMVSRKIMWTDDLIVRVLGKFYNPNEFCSFGCKIMKRGGLKKPAGNHNEIEL